MQFYVKERNPPSAFLQCKQPLYFDPLIGEREPLVVSTRSPERSPEPDDLAWVISASRIQLGSAERSAVGSAAAIIC